MDGERLVIGNARGNPVQVYAFDGASWVLEAELEGLQYEIAFGNCVAIDGNRIAVGSKNLPGFPGGGRAYLFVRTPSGWMQEDVLVGGFTGNFFGDTIDLSGDWLIVTDCDDWGPCPTHGPILLAPQSHPGQRKRNAYLGLPVVPHAHLGILFYGFGSASIPFQGGTLCAGPRLRRTALQNPSGTPPPALDFPRRPPRSPFQTS
jgi:hypothetical protein